VKALVDQGVPLFLARQRAGRVSEAQYDEWRRAGRVKNPVQPSRKRRRKANGTAEAKPLVIVPEEVVPSEADLAKYREHGWWALARCVRFPAEFFPERGQSTEAAKRVCAKCPVRADCLEEALANNVEEGVWGGTSGVERKRMRRQRALGEAS
jgi:hypothetical protein